MVANKSWVYPFPSVENSSTIVLKTPLVFDSSLVKDGTFKDES